LLIEIRQNTYSILARTVQSLHMFWWCFFMYIFISTFFFRSLTIFALQHVMFFSFHSHTKRFFLLLFIHLKNRICYLNSYLITKKQKKAVFYDPHKLILLFCILFSSQIYYLLFQFEQVDLIWPKWQEITTKVNNQTRIDHIWIFYCKNNGFEFIQKMWHLHKNFCFWLKSSETTTKSWIKTLATKHNEESR
jgi:hypothetical protein